MHLKGNMNKNTPQLLGLWREFRWWGVDSVVLVSALPVLAGHRHTHRNLSRPLLHSAQAVQRLHAAFQFRSRCGNREVWHDTSVTVLRKSYSELVFLKRIMVFFYSLIKSLHSKFILTQKQGNKQRIWYVNRKFFYWRRIAGKVWVRST